MGRFRRRFLDLTSDNGNAWRVTVSDVGALVVTDFHPALKALVKFTPAAVGGDAWDYTVPQVFTINDGTGATTVTLTGDLVNVAGVVAAVDAALGAGYVVTVDGAMVKIEAATVGDKTFVIGGADAAAITGSANYVNTAGTAGT